MGIRDTTYYGWRDLLNTSNFSLKFSTPTPGVSNRFYIWDFGVSPLSSSLMYAVGACVNSNTQNKWTTFRSINAGLNWDIVDVDPGDAEFSFATGLDFDLSGNVYVCGTAQHGYSGGARRFTVRKSSTGNTGSWQTIEAYVPANEYGIVGTASSPACFDIVVNRSSGSVYICGSPDNDDGGWLVRYSPTGASGSFSNIFGYNHAAGADHVAYSIALVKVDSTERLIIGGMSGSGPGSIFYSSNQSIPAVHSGNISLLTSSGDGNGFRDIAVSGNTVYSIYGASEVVGGFDYRLVKSSDGGATWSQADLITDVLTGAAESHGLSVAISPNYPFSVYSSGWHRWGSKSDFFLRRSDDGTNFSEIWQGARNAGSVINKVVMDSNNNIYLCGFVSGAADDAEFNQSSTAGRTSVGFVKIGKRTANSASLGPKSYAPSVAYVAVEKSGSVYEEFKLNNISEFPHYGGIFQMKNVVLGTVNSGKIGRDETNIVQVRHFGSFVKVLWPRQDSNSDIFVKGFGDFSSGQKPGKLESNWTSGEFIDVTEYDHLTLYCYAKKYVSGTMDNISIRVERRPIQDVPFTTEQSIAYATSGSFTTEGTLTDLIITKPIDYGDLSISEISYPIDIPLVNTKQIRISAKQKTGQNAEENKNFIVWGRLIKSDKNTNET